MTATTTTTRNVRCPALRVGAWVRLTGTDLWLGEVAAVSGRNVTVVWWDHGDNDSRSAVWSVAEVTAAEF